MKTNLLKVSIRQNAIFVPSNMRVASTKKLSQSTTTLIFNLKNLGYTVSEDLMYALNNMTPNQLLVIFNTMKEVLGVHLNWAPLVKGWNTPTKESQIDHTITLFANIFRNKKGIKGINLPCGHLIPDNTFPLERYNGCPFCGTPFELAKIEHYGQGSKLKVLNLWSENQLESYFVNLLQSRTALDATQVDSLETLIHELTLPKVEISIKETQIIVLDALVEKCEFDKCQQFISTPADILRYLWYKKTGFLQIIEPKTIIKRTLSNHVHFTQFLDQSEKTKLNKKAELNLKYNRAQCKIVAVWLNNLNIDVETACEIMHPKRGMWVRFIRALRLAEYAKKPHFEYLKELIDKFYNQSYTIYQGEIDKSRMRMDADTTFGLLKQRPGLFARSLFANMLWYGENQTLTAFEEVMDKIPMRLLFTLNMYAEIYFDPQSHRVVKPLGGITKSIRTNNLLALYNADQLREMISKVEDLCLKAISNRFKQVKTTSKTMYIDPMLFNIPLSIGDRSETIQDISGALMGTRFPIEGNSVRLFMQWGKDLPAQHLDMDLSCHIALPNSTTVCSYYNLVTPEAKHSGDIRSIPNKTGTAEYIELDLDELSCINAQYVAFTCNAYSTGALSPNLVVGWMNSAYTMTISEGTGVAYDPSCVQHQVRITQGLSKGLIFGVLEVATREIIWIEMPFSGQIVANMDAKTLEAFIKKLSGKTTIGNLLSIKAQAQNITLVDTEYADDIYNMSWAMDTAGVTKLFID